MATLDVSKLHARLAQGDSLNARKELQDTYQDFVEDIEALHDTPIHPSINLSQVVRRFGDIGVTGLLDPGVDASKASSIDLACAVRAVGYQLGYPLGTVVVLNIINDRYSTLSASIIPDSTEEEVYLDRPLVIAQAQMRSPEGLQSLAFSVGNLVLYDPARILKDSANGLAFLAHQATDADASPFARSLAVRLARMGIGLSDYTRVCGIVRLRMEEMQHAKDYVFADAMLGREAQPDEMADLLLRKDSSLRERLLQIKEVPRKNYLSSAITEYSGSLGGIIMELDQHLGQDRPEDALLAFDDFMWTKDLRAAHSAAGMYAGEALLFKSRLQELLGHSAAQPDRIHSLIGSPSVDKHARNARLLLQALYCRDFYEDDQRRELIRSR